jgi:hypothetical protein
MLAHACREKVRPPNGRETGLGHAEVKATKNAVAEKNDSQPVVVTSNSRKKFMI